MGECGSKQNLHYQVNFFLVLYMVQFLLSIATFI